MPNFRVSKSATAMTFTVAILYTFTCLGFLVVPDLSYGYFQSWFHGIGVSTDGFIAAYPTSLESFLLGLFCICLTAFVVTSVFVYFFKKVSRFERSATHHEYAS